MKIIYMMGAFLATADASVMAHPKDSQNISSVIIAKPPASFDSLPSERLEQITQHLGFEDFVSLRHVNLRLLHSAVPNIENFSLKHGIKIFPLTRDLGERSRILKKLINILKR